MACVGTFSSLKKSLAASSRVIGSSVASRVRLLRRLKRLVEADVPVAADAQQLHVDAAGPLDRGFVAAAMVVDLVGRHRAVGNVDVLGGMFTCSKKLLVHPAVVALQLVGLAGRSIRRG